MTAPAPAPVPVPVPVPEPEPLRSPWRAAAAATTAATAAAHVPLVPEHLGEAPYLGVLFVLLVVACLVLAVRLVRGDTRRVWLAATGTCAAALVAYAVSRTLGLPQAHDDVGRWTEPLGVVAVAAEAATAALGLAALLGAGRRGGWWASGRRPAAVGAAVLALGLASTGIAAASTTTDHGTQAGTGGRGVTRTYFLGADPVDWDYAPDHRNDITGRPFGPAEATWVAGGPGRVGTTYAKCLYRAYTDDAFTRRVPSTPDDAALGLLGPVVRAEVGDTVRVVFRNACPFPASVHPHGVLYDKASEGAPYADGTSGADTLDDAVPPGGRHTYTWRVPERAGPGPHDGSSVMWMYHSHTDEVADTYAGLVGPLVVTRRGAARADGSPRDVDRELFALFAVADENQSPLLEESLERAGTTRPEGDDEAFEESNLMHAVNGHVFGNLPSPAARVGERVRWYVMSTGTEVDLHTPHWHGNVATVSGMRTDVVSLLPGSMVVADMVPDAPGTWLFHCHVGDHITAGMVATYRVLPAS